MIPLGGIGRTKAKLNVEKTFDMLRSRGMAQMHLHTIKEMSELRMDGGERERDSRRPTILRKGKSQENSMPQENYSYNALRYNTM